VICKQEPKILPVGLLLLLHFIIIIIY